MLLRLRIAEAGFGSGSPERLLLLRVDCPAVSGGAKDMLLLLRMFPDPELGGAGRPSCSSSATGSVLAERDPGPVRAVTDLEFVPGGELALDAEAGRPLSSPSPFSSSPNVFSTFALMLPRTCFIF